MLSSRRIQYGALQGVILTFENSGDVLPWHTHGPNDAHITIVARGRLLMEVRDPAMSREIGEGALVDTAPGVWHQFTAMAANSRIFQIVKEPLLGTDTAR